MRVPVPSFGTATFGAGDEFFGAWGETDVPESEKARRHVPRLGRHLKTDRVEVGALDLRAPRLGAPLSTGYCCNIAGSTCNREQFRIRCPGRKLDGVKEARMNVRPLALLLVLSTFGCASTPAPAPPTLRQLYGIAPIARVDAHRTALQLVDFQEEFLHGRLAMDDAPRAVARAAELLAWARANGLAVVHVQNVAKPGSPIFAQGSPAASLVPALAPGDGETVVTKPGGGAFTKTGLDATLRERGIDTVVIAGIMAQLAVAMSAQDASVLGYRVIVASDATTTRDLPDPSSGAVVDREAVQRAALAGLGDRFADVLPVRRIVALPLEPSPQRAARR
jgi:nicotinamidase-related amidase